MFLASGSEALWYLTRGTGLVTLLLLTASVVLGILGAKRWSSPRWPRFVTAGLHRNVSLLAVAFLAVHIATSVVDGYVTITWLNAVVPFTAAYRPLWLGFGAVAGDLLVALVATSVARRFIGYRAWRAVHWAAYACWPIAVVHAVGTGTDAAQGWGLALVLASLGVVAAATAWRLAAGGRGAAPGRVRAVASGAAAAAASGRGAAPGRVPADASGAAAAAASGRGAAPGRVRAVASGAAAAAAGGRGAAPGRVPADAVATAATARPASATAAPARPASATGALGGQHAARARAGNAARARAGNAS